MNAMAVWIVVAGLGQMNERFYQDFRPGNLVAPSMTPLQIGPSGRILPGSQGIQLSLPEKHPANDVIGYSPIFQVGGNFQITVRYKIVSAGKPEKGMGAGLKIWGKFAGQKYCAVTLGHFKTPDSDKSLIVSVLGTGQGQDRQFQTQSVPASAEHGRLRLVRENNRLTFLFAPGDSDSFIELQSGEVVPENLTNLRIVATSHEDPAAVNVQLLEFEVLADRLAGAQPVVKKRWNWRWIVLPIAVAGAGVGGFLLWLRHRKSTASAPRRSTGKTTRTMTKGPPRK
ncbi:MAG: hypothetical protein KatS3mg110_4068 [Pirellulaceae bacterium]|nr:MAG: hypothetical protein KatS3mg110_4068 [Pirellulaceae bacterium]